MEKINTIEINLIKLLAMLLEQIEVFQILDTRSKLQEYTCMLTEYPQDLLKCSCNSVRVCSLICTCNKGL